MMMVVMVSGSESGGGAEHQDGENQKLFHRLMVPSEGGGCIKIEHDWVRR
jgi:hypothetical protein